MILDPMGRDVRRQIQVNIGDIVGQHFLVDTAGHDVTRGQIFPLRVILLHKWLAIGVNQACACPPHRLGDEKARGVLIIKCCRVELDKLAVDDPRPGPVGHRQPVSARACWIGSAQKNLSQTAAGQDGLLCQTTNHPLPRLIQEIRPYAGTWRVDCQPVEGVV